MDVKYAVSDHAQESFKLAIILTICHTFSVSSQNTFPSADFCW